jgi:hypothetical protein
MLTRVLAVAVVEDAGAWALMVEGVVNPKTITAATARNRDRVTAAGPWMEEASRVAARAATRVGKARSAPSFRVSP